ncbi:hypothetical protein SAMN05445756_1784 [Kytococcus aerolatus]|uniref:Uncharacterized protein n=1 Tax=Kytococcus aerolatus TaxID=592308 RepID=A0A212U2B6_9MICO|nr:hypothetical protein [Kytococcus aerolatus]SNC72266.1 hypothetical protein SAMN05445756_1784 [Kytococcus aerolatus]
METSHLPLPELVVGAFSLLVVLTVRGGERDPLYMGLSVAMIGLITVVGAARSRQFRDPGWPWALKTSLFGAAMGVAVFIPTPWIAMAIIIVATTTYAYTYFRSAREWDNAHHQSVGVAPQNPR